MKTVSYSLILLITACLLFSGFTSMAGPDEAIAQITTAIQAGNAADISKNFSAMVDLTLPGYDDTYSKTQAGQILKDFFTQNQVKSFKITRQGSSPDGSYYGIGSLETGKKAFRVYFILKNVNNQSLIQQFQIQEN